MKSRPASSASPRNGSPVRPIRALLRHDVRLTLHQGPPFLCSLSCHVALEESGLEYETVEINTKTQANLTESYTAINPLGKVPALAIEGRILTEAAAILSYIADRVPEKELLPPAGTLKRAIAHEWLNFISSTVHIAFRPVFRPERVAEGDVCVNSVRRLGVSGVIEALKYAEARLGK